jgi:dTDP-4-amino-4,6-dideoxygalactose transaminase
MGDAYQVVRDLESAVCEYTGAPFCVTTNSCTNALLIALLRGRYKVARGAPVVIPKRTYISVPMVITLAGFKVEFDDREWRGEYRLLGTDIWDCARRFTGGMYAGGVRCVSFHASKILGDTQGGAILHDNPDLDLWFRKMRFDGRTEGVHPKDDNFDTIGLHCYMSPDVAARLLLKLSVLPKRNNDLPNDDYPDLSKIGLFK